MRSVHKFLPQLLTTCKECIDNKGHVGALLIDLSKAVDWLNKYLLATLDTYGFDTIALKVIHSSLYRGANPIFFRGGVRSRDRVFIRGRGRLL